MKPSAGKPCFAALILLALSCGSACGQTANAEAFPQFSASDPVAQPAGTVSLSGFQQPPEPQKSEAPAAGDSDPDDVFCEGGPGYVSGFDFLLIRPHFSQALAFAEGRQTAASLTTEGRELHWDYEAAFRVFAGYRFSESDELRFTYWRVTSATGERGRITQPGQFIVDPFGNIAGGVVIIDPSSALFGQAVIGGDTISARARVEMHLYDLDFIRTLSSDCCSPWTYGWSAGVRIADVDQLYTSTITRGGAFFAGGDFSADFLGIGPRLGVHGKHRFGPEGNFALFANAHGSLLVGNYDVRSSVTVTALGPFQFAQQESLTRTIPVVEAEFGGTWRMGESLSVSAGWMLQAWHDLGASGGTFGGLFVGNDDANIMSFDGLFLRGELAY